MKNMKIMYILTVNLQCIISFWSNPTLQHIFEKCCLVHLADTYVPKEKSLSISLKKKEKKSTTFDWHVEADCLQSKRQTRRSMLKKKKNQFTAFYLQNTCIITCITQNWSDPKRKMEKKNYRDQYQIWTNTPKTLDWYTFNTCDQRLSKYD